MGSVRLMLCSSEMSVSVAATPSMCWIRSLTSDEKPIIKRGLPFLSNHLSKEEGVIGVYLTLNKELVPCIQIRFAAPMTADRIWELLNLPKWTITYSKDDVREEDPRMKFDAPGVCFPM